MRIFAIWLGRVLANALAGGLAFAIVGAFCGALTGFILGISSVRSLDAGFVVATFGARVGAICAIAGILIHLFAVLSARPDEFWQPFFDFAPRVAFGQFWGTIAAISAFFAFEFANAQLQGGNMGRIVRQDGIFLIVLAPILMICGAIAGAIFKRD